MTRQSSRPRLAIIFALLALLALVQTHVPAQTKTTEQPPPNYTRPTVLTRPVTQPQPVQPASAQPTLPPATPDIAPPPPVIITQGLLVETLDGKAVAEQDAYQAYNPASAVKLGTALAALKNFGVEHRFSTAVWTTGSFDAATGTITLAPVTAGTEPG